MDAVARNVFYVAMSLDVFVLAWISFFKNQKAVRSVIWIFLMVFSVHFLSVLLYSDVRNGLPLDMRTQDCLIRTWVLSGVLVYAWTKYRDRIVVSCILLAQILLFLFAFPMPVPSKMHLCVKLSSGVALPLSVLIYDFSVVVFAYSWSLSLAWLVRRKEVCADKFQSCAGSSLYDRIGNCALWGLGLFTLSQVVGSFGKLVQQGTYWDWNPFHLLFVAVWLFYAAMVHVKWIKGMSRMALPVLGIIGFVGIVGFRVVFMV